MIKIGLLSDTHSFLHPKIFEFFADCDELWHAGDIGDMEAYDELAGFKKLRAVHGNVDSNEIRLTCPERLVFNSEGVKILMTHIGGYPGRYDPRARFVIERERPNLFICGHSHILKVIYDKKFDLLYMNPGAAGKTGLHMNITLLRFVIEGSNIRDLEIFDLPRQR
jgi:uncharacterized protein